LWLQLVDLVVRRLSRRQSISTRDINPRLGKVKSTIGIKAIRLGRFRLIEMVEVYGQRYRLRMVLV